MDINGGDKNRVFLHDLIKITEGTVSEETIFMHSIVNQSEFDCVEIKSNSDPRNIENSIVDQSEPNCEKIKNHSDQERIENSIVDQSEFDCVEIQNNSDPKNTKIFEFDFENENTIENEEHSEII